MATIVSGGVTLLDPADFLVTLAPTRRLLSYASAYARRLAGSGVTLLDPADFLFTTTNQALRTRSTGSLGYGGAPVVGTVLSSAIILPPGRTQVAYYPGAAYATVLTSQRIDTGIENNTDLPASVQAFRNGALDATWVPTLTAVRTGVYAVTAALPLTWAKGDSIQIVARATVNGVTENETLDSFQLGGVPSVGQVYP